MQNCTQKYMHANYSEYLFLLGLTLHLVVVHQEHCDSVINSCITYVLKLTKFEKSQRANIINICNTFCAVIFINAAEQQRLQVSNEA